MGDCHQRRIGCGCRLLVVKVALAFCQRRRLDLDLTFSSAADCHGLLLIGLAREAGGVRSLARSARD